MYAILETTWNTYFQRECVWGGIDLIGCASDFLSEQVSGKLLLIAVGEMIDVKTAALNLKQTGSVRRSFPLKALSSCSNEPLGRSFPGSDRPEQKKTTTANNGTTRSTASCTWATVQQTTANMYVYQDNSASFPYSGLLYTSKTVTNKNNCAIPHNL